MYQASDKCTKEGSEKDIRAVHNYAQKALDANPNDAKLKDFRDEVKEKFDKFKAEESKAGEQAKEEQNMEGKAEKNTGE